MKRLIARALAATLLLTTVFARAAAPQPTELQCDRMEMWSTDTETRAICTGSVTVNGTNMRILCNRLEIIAERIGDDRTSTVPILERFKYLLATGNVRIVQGDREATCGRAEVLPLEDKIVLTEDPVVIDRGEDWIQAGEEITMLRGERRVIVTKARLTGPSIKDLGFDKDKPAKPETEKENLIKVPSPK